MFKSVKRWTSKWKKQHKQRAKGMKINDSFGEGREVGVVGVKMSCKDSGRGRAEQGGGARP